MTDKIHETYLSKQKAFTDEHDKAYNATEDIEIRTALVLLQKRRLEQLTIQRGLELANAEQTNNAEQQRTVEREE